MEKNAVQKMLGRIVNYRVGPRNQNPKECLIQFPNIEKSSDASKLVGQKVVWTGAKRKKAGLIIRLHGGKGLVIARFREGVPGQAVGSTVELVT
jgi:large subunit ribosomal protein L35Ae